jgi:S1-C subfamily serine protease
MSERFRVRLSLIIGLAAVSLWACSGGPSIPKARWRSAMVARVLPAVVSITTRQIERNQFNQPVPTRRAGSASSSTAGVHPTNSHVVADAPRSR